MSVGWVKARGTARKLKRLVRAATHNQTVGGSRRERLPPITEGLRDEAAGVLDLLEGEFPVVLAAQVELLMIELGHRLDVRRILEAFLKGVVQRLDDLGVHPFRTGDAEG